MYTMKKNGEEQFQASRNTKTLMIDLKQGKGKLIGADRAAEERRVLLVLQVDAAAGVDVEGGA